ncbi:MAG: tetratricopeptide repeat protein [Alphaproteobacteria bacterium]|nr:tetratricopeptide repeat protein [Alphaproteobacteria bacterium]MBU6473340.1 tetratricopeptide repeat protein [Alphaproteobacteria bacterium]MDE2014215.1 tetratricopeptide repeat protein [Alphaproteobacteria bacterium]MDE2074534.1 tetratricopeptide repeat protein [Alphaproteobacteria bacterium]
MRYALLLAVTILLLGAVAAPAAPASPLDNPALPGATRYDRCLALAESRPRAALAAAEAWRGGGAAAAHCQAVALVGIGRYSEAALKLDGLARDPAITDSVHRADLFDQAGNAWLLAHKSGPAQSSFSEALRLEPGNPDLLADRARAKALDADWTGADSDLSAALTRDPRRPDLLVLRASARRALHRLKEALADVEAALRLKPNDAEALVERGALKFDAGDKEGAVADWQKTIALAPGSDAARSAREHLAQLGVNGVAK